LGGGTIPNNRIADLNPTYDLISREERDAEYQKVYSIPIMFAMDFSNKTLRHQDTKTRSLMNNKHLLFVSLCLGGYSSWLIRFRL